MKIAIIVGSIAVGLFLLVFVLPKVVLHFMAGGLNDRIADVYSADQVLMKDLTANSFGRESKGMAQIRGNGALVLTANELHFFMVAPKTDVRIPLSSITEVSFTRSHTGKAVARDLLKVDFTVDGQPDAIAWFLEDPDAWKAKLEQLIRATGTGG